MQLVKGQGEEEVKKEQTERKINFEQAYQVRNGVIVWLYFYNLNFPCNDQDAVMNEVDSGTELESQGEEEEEAAPAENKDDEEKKDDWVLKKDHNFYSKDVLSLYNQLD